LKIEYSPKLSGLATGRVARSTVITVTKPFAMMESTSKKSISMHAEIQVSNFHGTH
jgi:hypothetical protein